VPAVTLVPGRCGRSGDRFLMLSEHGATLRMLLHRLQEQPLKTIAGVFPE